MITSSFLHRQKSNIFKKLTSKILGKQNWGIFTPVKATKFAKNCNQYHILVFRVERDVKRQTIKVSVDLNKF